MSTKTCSKCDSTKPVDEFRKNRSVCKPCYRKQVGVYRENNRAKTRASSLKWFHKNKDRAHERQRVYNASPAGKIVKRTRKLSILYGLTIEEWDNLFISQNYRCAICNCEARENMDWHTDHCHKTGKIRGILCPKCNIGIGALGDSYINVAAAARYLAKAENIIQVSVEEEHW